MKAAKNNTPIGIKFHEVLLGRFNSSRRNSAVASLALYLLDQSSISKTAAASYPFKLETKTVVQQFGAKLMRKLFAGETNEIEGDGDENLEEPAPAELSFRDELKASIGNRWGKAHAQHAQAEKPSTDTSAIQKIFRTYDQHREKSLLLENLFLALCGTPPTSTQSERNFSSSGNFVSKLRTRLSPEHVDMLSFLKSYFLNKRRSL